LEWILQNKTRCVGWKVGIAQDFGFSPRRLNRPRQTPIIPHARARRKGRNIGAEKQTGTYIAGIYVNAMLLKEFLKEHRNVAEQQSIIAELKTTVAQQQKQVAAQQATPAQQQKQIEALTATVQRASEHFELSAPAPEFAANENCCFVCHSKLCSADLGPG
jgi:hypothetical protein